MIIKNVHELQKALAKARKEEDPVHYMNTVHKIRISISMLGNEEFAAAIEAVKTAFKTRSPKTASSASSTTSMPSAPRSSPASNRK